MSDFFRMHLARAIYAATLMLLSGCERPIQFSQPIGEPILLKGTKFEGSNLWNFDYFGPSGPGNPSLHTTQIGPDEFALMSSHFDTDGKNTVHRAVAKIHKIPDFAYDEGVHVLILEIFRDLRQSRGGNWNSIATNCEAVRSNFRVDTDNLENQGFRLARNLSEEGDAKSLNGTENPAPGPEIRMVRVEGGRLPSGSKLADADVAGFEIGAFEVTWDQWRSVHEWALKNGYTGFPDWEQMADLQSGSSGSHPVRSVSWKHAVLWSNALSEMAGLSPVYFNVSTSEVYKDHDDSIVPWRNPDANGYRLPTEAEWEWAARGGTKSGGHAYSGGSDLKEVAWYAENSGSRESGPQPVGGKKANELGLFDMSGNVDEWCEESQIQYMYFLMTSPHGREVAFYWMNNSEILMDARAGRISVNSKEPPTLVTANKSETEKYIRENRPRLFSVIEPIVAKWVGGTAETITNSKAAPSHGGSGSDYK